MPFLDKVNKNQELDTMQNVPSLEANPPPNLLSGLYDFVRSHLLIVNNVVLASATLVGVLDFLAPRLSFAPTIVYSMTACLTLLMVFAAFAPALTARLVQFIGGPKWPRFSGLLWRNPAWQVAVAILLVVSIIGFSSVAKASQGGLIASQFPVVSNFQASLLGINRDVAEIRHVVAAANDKLDSLVADSRDPQKSLVASGYTYDDSGLMKAIRQGDKRAVGSFVNAGYVVTGRGPLAVVLNGDGSWDASLIANLPKSMFTTKDACAEGRLLNYELKSPASERIGAFKRLCDSAPVALMLKQNIANDQLTDAPNEQWSRMRAARRSNLSALSQ